MPGEPPVTAGPPIAPLYAAAFPAAMLPKCHSCAPRAFTAGAPSPPPACRPRRKRTKKAVPKHCFSVVIWLSADNEELIAALYGLANGNSDGFNGASVRSHDRVAHLHSFEDHYFVAFSNGVADFLADAGDLAGHRGVNSGFASCNRSCCCRSRSRSCCRSRSRSCRRSGSRSRSCDRSRSCRRSCCCSAFVNFYIVSYAINGYSKFSHCSSS